MLRVISFRRIVIMPLLLVGMLFQFAQADEVSDRLARLEKAIVHHERFQADAQACLTLPASRPAVLENYRKAVQVVQQAILAKKPAEEIAAALSAADAKLSTLEATVRRESLAICLLEQANLSRSVLPLMKDESAREKFTVSLDAIQGDTKNLFAEEAADETIDKNMTALYGRLREMQKDLYAVAGWQPGVSGVGFGRFGFHLTDGLLCDTVAFDSVKTTEEQQQLGRTDSSRTISTLGCDILFPEVNAVLSFGPRGIPKLSARKISLNWIGKTIALSSPDHANLGVVYTTLQRPATRFRFSSSAVTCPVRKIAPAESALRYLTSDGWNTVEFSSKSSIPGSQLERSWVLLDLVDTEQKVPARRGRHTLVVLQFQKKLTAIIISPDGLELVGKSGEFGNLWVFRPCGVDREKQGTVSPKQVQKITDLCRLNLAWPTECNEMFQVDPAGQNVRIRDEVKFDRLQDDWGTEPLAATAVPPVLMLAKSYGVPGVKISEPLTDWDVPTKYGPFATVVGPMLNYTLPVPPLYQHAFLLVDRPEQKQWSERINASAGYQGKIDGTTPDQAFRGIASLWPAREYLKPEKAELVKKASHVIATLLQPGYYWNRFLWRMEPLSNRRYCYDYPLGHYNEGPMYDMGWSNSLVLYGLGHWASYEGHWDELDRAWPEVWSLVEYLDKSHDWAWMADSITEFGEGAAIDCLAASHAGLVSAVRMARTLNKPVEAAQAAYLSAKTALPHTTRFAFLEYIRRHDLWHDDSPGIGTVNGFHEYGAWIHPRHAPPWWGVCSLSGFGIEPECFDAMLFYVGPARMKTWWNVVKTIYPEWFKADKPYPQGTIYGGNSNYVTTPALYLEFRLGVGTDQLLRWMQQADIKDGCDQNPNVYGEIANRDGPVQLAAWGRCTFEQARFDPTSRVARVTFTNPTDTPQPVQFRCTVYPAGIRLDGQPVQPEKTIDAWKQKLLTFNVPPGKHLVEMLLPTD